MRKYEFMAILDPSTGEDARNTLISELRSEISATGASVTSEDLWGERRLAYRIHGSAVGFYVVFQIEMDGQAFFSLTKSFNLKRDLWRFIFVRLDR